MSKGRRDRTKEYDQVQKLKSENKLLKRQIARLRKQLDRIDVEHFQNLKEIVKKQRKEDLDLYKEEEHKSLEEKWKCHKCDDGVLRIVIIDRRNGVFYFRRCPSCGNRTKVKPYTEDVKGVK